MQSQMSAGYELSPQQKRIFGQGLENASAGLAILLEGAIEPRKIKQIVQVHWAGLNKD